MEPVYFDDNAVKACVANNKEVIALDEDKEGVTLGGNIDKYNNDFAAGAPDKEFKEYTFHGWTLNS